MQVQQGLRCTQSAARQQNRVRHRPLRAGQNCSGVWGLSGMNLGFPSSHSRSSSMHSLGLPLTLNDCLKAEKQTDSGNYFSVSKDPELEALSLSFQRNVGFWVSAYTPGVALGAGRTSSPDSGFLPLGCQDG